MYSDAFAVCGVVGFLMSTFCKFISESQNERKIGLYLINLWQKLSGLLFRIIASIRWAKSSKAQFALSN